MISSASCVRGLRVGFAFSLAVAFASAACGGGDDAGSMSSGGSSGSSGSSGSAGSDSSASGEADAASAGSGGQSSTGGSVNAGAGGSVNAGTGGKLSSNAGSGGTAAAEGGASWSGNFDDCDPPMDGVEHCTADNPDHAGTSGCTEFYTVGLGKVVCGDLSATGPCPRDESLYGICVAAFSTYEYDSNADGATFFQASPRDCEAQGGKWCGPR
jgi:hypothetical protein